MKASDLFLRCLEAQGVTHIYGVPGEENADLMISLLNSSIEFVICRHEQAASFMADMHGRLTGKPGVCLATLGPGATNLMTGVANANMDHVPLIAIIGQADTTRLHKVSHQNMDSVSMYEPVTKWATTVRNAEVIPEVVCKAVKTATIGVPGAVLIELPEDVAKEETDAQPINLLRTEFESGVSDEQIQETLALIKASKKPILLVGDGAVAAEADKEIRALMDKTNMYGATTFMGKGAIDARHKHSLRCVGLGMKDIAVKAYDEADLVITIGYNMVEWPPSRWNEKADKKIIHIARSAAEVDACYIPRIELIGEINEIVCAINKGLTKDHEKDPQLFAKIREEVENDIDLHEDDDSFPIKPQRILADVRKALRDDDILVSDVGAHKMWVARQYPTYQSKTCFIYNGFCSMGGSMAGATQAKWIHPDKNAVAIVGDGGFIMSIQALVTAVQYKAPITVLVWEDHFYGLIKWKQEAAYHKMSHVELKNPDLVALAKSFGCHSEKLESTDQLLPALKASFEKKDKPTVLVVPVDYSENMKLTEHLGKILSH
ncbi:MAG: acetolactate synthase large subunit [Legionellaceae bacterium]|nr:acetolactate synthase large subunit [Legionellaceae bacterium]